MVRLNRQIVRRFEHRKGRGLRQKLHERALMLGVEVLHEHQCRAGAGRQIFEQSRERLQPARRRAHADNPARPGVCAGPGAFGFALALR